MIPGKRVRRDLLVSRAFRVNKVRRELAKLAIRARWVRKVSLATLVLPDLRANKVSRVFRVRKVWLVTLGLLEQLELKVFRARPVILVRLGLPVLRVQLELQGQRVQLVPPDHKVLKAMSVQKALRAPKDRKVQLVRLVQPVLRETLAILVLLVLLAKPVRRVRALLVHRWSTRRLRWHQMRQRSILWKLILDGAYSR